MPRPKTTIEQDLPVRAQQGDENALAALNGHCAFAVNI